MAGDLVFGSEYDDAVTAARIVLLAAAIQFAVGWTKTLPVTIGRPRLRIWTHGLETLVAIPLVAVLGAEWGRHGRGGRCARLDAGLRGRVGRRDPAAARRGASRGAGERGVAPGVKVVIVSGIWPPDPGGPASHAPALADFLAPRGHGVEVVTTADTEPGARSYPILWASRRSPFRHLRARSSRAAGGAPLGRGLRDEHGPACRARLAARAPAARREARLGRGVRTGRA